MTQTNRFWKFVLLSASGIFLAAGSMMGFIWFKLSPADRLVLLAMGEKNVYPLLILTFIVFGALWIVFDITYNTYVRPLKKMAAEAGLIYTSNPSHRIALTGSKDITTLARVINDFADMFENLNKNITQQILAARKETEKERNLLAAIMAELPQGIIICNKNGRILLYNSLAKQLFIHKTAAHKTEHFIGLGRSIFHLIDKNLIAHAVDEIQERLNSHKTSTGSFFITPIYTGGLISVEAIPILDQNALMTGFILAVQDASQDIEKYETIDTHLSAFQNTLETEILKAGAQADVTALRIPSLELDQIQKKYHQVSSLIREISFSRLPLTNIDLKNFLPALQKKTGYEHGIRVNIFNDQWNTRIMADAYSMTRAFVFLFENLSRLTGLTEFNLKVSHSTRNIRFDLAMDESPCKLSDIKEIMHQKINALPSLGYVLKFNNSLYKLFSRDNTFCHSLRIIAKQGKDVLISAKQRSPVVTGSRPEFYDFDMFNVDEYSKNLLDASLKQITYTVFDTETTGLNPDGGDEIVSIGAVRIVNNRIQYQDIFEELVDPRRDIPLASYRIHGINYEMIKEKDPIEKVLPIFKKFTSETVLLGHNLAFDLKMFKLKEKSTGITFNNPALDTLLLSAALHPIHEQHDLENIARRLGVNLIGRHTAVGDAITTAEIFLKLIPILNSNGILTLKDAIKASQKTYYARLKY